MRRSFLVLTAFVAVGVASAEIETASAARPPVESAGRHRFAFSPRRDIALTSATVYPHARVARRMIIVDAPRPIDRTTDPWTGETVAEDPDAASGLHHRLVVRVPRPIDTDDPWAPAPANDGTVVNDGDDRAIASNAD